MAINPHDDYEALAKLLYPSIEASGNVYYGQTRKLAIDELFDKNNSGFESYFCSCRKEDDSSQYEQHFHWKLGPFSDTVKVVDAIYKNYPLAWLKYSLIKRESNHKNILNNASYNIYDVEYNLGQLTSYCTYDGLLPNGSTYNNSNFFLNEEYGTLYLYVLLYKAPVYEDMDKPLYIEALTDDIQVKLVPIDPDLDNPLPLDQCVYKYGYEHTGQAEDLLLNTSVIVKKGHRIYLKCENRPEFSDINYVQFEITSDNEDAEVAVGGNIESMAKFEENGDMLDYAYQGLFHLCPLITDVSKLYIGKLSDHSCENLFSECARLKMAPAILPCLELKSYCYKAMFILCPALENAPVLPAKNGSFHCYALMFDNSFVSEVTCLLNPHDDTYTYLWLYGLADVKIRVLQDSGWESANSDTLPEDYTLIELHTAASEFSGIVLSSDAHIEKYLVAHGTNNENNGRGDITDSSTLANMEKSFDENNNHPMNTYNSDGSFNQEIWGYKSFCSPVQFRNGIYTDNLAIFSTYGSYTEGGYDNHDLIGSTIKSVENDDLEIRLINETYKNPMLGSETKNNLFEVILNGYNTQTKYAPCSASMISTGYYNDGTENYSCTSNISVYSNRDTTASEISVYNESTMSVVRTEMYNNESEINLSVRADRETSILNISKSGFKFTGYVFADSITSDVVYNTTIYTSEISTVAQTSNININCSITSHGDIKVDSGGKFKGNLDGVIPYIDSSSFNENRIVPIGCIVFLRVKYTEPPFGSLVQVGVYLSSNHSDYTLHIGCFDDASVVAADDTANPALARDQFFRTLSRGKCVNNITHVLAIRVDETPY